MNRLAHYNHPFTPAPAPTQPPVQWAPRLHHGSFKGEKAAGGSFDHPYVSSAEVEDWVELTYLNPSLCLRDMLQGELYHYLCTVC